MRALIQRVNQASVTIRGEITGEIGPGLLVLLGIENEDGEADIRWLAKKILQLRIFDDEDGVMNRSVQDIKGGLLIVSQFTLHASTKKGNRPSYIKAAKPDVAVPLYEAMIKELRETSGLKVDTGEFGAYMEVALVNDGPVTIWIDSKNRE
jgi:D-tyrosyl-tRNA(Tyr) deacylase